MLHLITINFNKKLSFISVLFMLISLLAIYFVVIYNASFNVSQMVFLDENKLIVNEFFRESFQLIELIEVIFIILLVELELFYNTDNFDSYFISLKGKQKFYISKMITYLMIILIYTFLVFAGLTIIYLVRFQNVSYIRLILEGFYFYVIYLLVIYSMTYIFMLLFRNYFSAMLIFIYYWFCKIIELKSNILATLFPNIIVDVDTMKISFETNIVFILIYLVVLFFVLTKIYIKTDLKINS